MNNLQLHRHWGVFFFFETVTSAYHLPNLGNKKGGMREESSGWPLKHGFREVCIQIIIIILINKQINE